MTEEFYIQRDEELAAYTRLQNISQQRREEIEDVKSELTVVYYAKVRMFPFCLRNIIYLRSA